MTISNRSYPYKWRVRRYLPDRYGAPCRITARGKLNSIRVEFEDGFEVITSRWFAVIRKDILMAESDMGK